MNKKRKYKARSAEFKFEAVRRMLAGENVKALSRVLEVPRSVLYEWLDKYREQGAQRLRGPGRPPLGEESCAETPAEVAARRIAELERKVGQQALEVDFLRKAFKHVKERRQTSTAPGAPASTGRSDS